VQTKTAVKTTGDCAEKNFFEPETGAYFYKKLFNVIHIFLPFVNIFFGKIFQTKKYLLILCKH